MTPPVGAVIDLCGIAYTDDGNVVDFGTYLGYFSCDNRNGNGDYPLTNLIVNFESSFFDGKTTCFQDSYEVGVDDNFDACTTFLVFGMNAGSGTPNYVVKFSYKISITYNC